MKVYVLICCFKDDKSQYPIARTVGIYRTLKEAREKLNAPIFNSPLHRMVIDEVDFKDALLKIEDKGA